MSIIQVQGLKFVIWTVEIYYERSCCNTGLRGVMCNSSISSHAQSGSVTSVKFDFVFFNTENSIKNGMIKHWELVFDKRAPHETMRSCDNAGATLDDLVLQWCKSSLAGRCCFCHFSLWKSECSDKLCWTTMVYTHIHFKMILISSAIMSGCSLPWPACYLLSVTHDSKLWNAVPTSRGVTTDFGPH